MREDVALCTHFAALAPGAGSIDVASDEILEYYDGPVVAVARCATCGACGWLELLDWDPARRLRVFALAAIRSEDVALYLRDRARGSCDAGRARAELEALAASAGPFERLVALELPALRVVAAAPVTAPLRAPAGAWTERVPAPGDGRWFARVGLANDAPH
jgi:hypothetical protein